MVTNALTIATELASAEGMTVVVTGGMMRPSELSLVGHITEQALRDPETLTRLQEMGIQVIVAERR